MDLIDEPASTTNAPEFTVSEISGAVKRALEGEFAHVRVRGEVGRVVQARTGHLYFDLKDDRNVIACVSWKGQAARLAHRPEEGMEVIATGRLTAYGPQSKYQLNVEDVRPAGAGALMAMLEARKAKLAAEGLFDADRKRPLPYLPEVIGIVTSPTGAVIRDILHRLRDRFPRKVLVWPVAVQGRDCAAQVAAAIEGFNRLPPGGAIPRPDLIIVARGGGSIEDLWGFNEEIVARAAVSSAISLISAVGHETDTTLLDHVADWRAPTPTAAAERAVPVRLELLAATSSLAARLSHAAERRIADRRQRLTDLGRGLPRPEALTVAAQQRLDIVAQRLPRALIAVRQVKAMRLAGLTLRPGLLSAAVKAHRRDALALETRAAPALARRIDAAREALSRHASRLGPAVMADRLLRAAEQRDRQGARLRPALVTDRVARGRERAEALARMMNSLGHRATLLRGYAIVRAGGEVVTHSEAAAAAPRLELEFADGRVTVGQTRAAPRKPQDPPPEQGTLL